MKTPAEDDIDNWIFAVNRGVTYNDEVYAIREVLEPPTKHPDEDDYRFMMQRLILKLSCNSTSCFWKEMIQELVPANFGGTLMVLPSGYTCQGRLSPLF